MQGVERVTQTSILKEVSMPALFASHLSRMQWVIKMQFLFRLPEEFYCASMKPIVDRTRIIYINERIRFDGTFRQALRRIVFCTSVFSLLCI